MPSNNKNNKLHNDKASRRKRVNQLKYLIVFAAVILLLTSVVLNIVLAFKILHLEEQIDKLYSQSNMVVIQNHLY